MEALENAEVSSELDQQLEDDFVLLVSSTVSVCQPLTLSQLMKANSGEAGLPVYVIEEPQ